ncbi:MAG: hypothetical protein K0R98_71 [Rickettsiaceae bacterium]|jgi:hypothetical protein|nr:hypothetical protein [Rickettsiaceae bacterium]
MKKLLIAFLFSILASQAHAECQEDYKTMAVSGKNCPQDVIDIKERINSCGHFSGEYGYDEERKEFLDKQISELRCKDLENEKNALQLKYKDNSYILRFLGLKTDGYTDYENYSGDYTAAEELQEALRTNDRQTVANLITYPLDREEPLPPIKNSQEFLENWDDYFNAEIIDAITTSTPDTIGWRGVQLNGGSVWFADGGIKRFNFTTDKYNQKLANAKKLESEKLYPSAKGYDKIVFQCSTDKLYIRTQYHGEDLRYFAWKKGATLSSKPEIELTSGKIDYQGTGGNYVMTFKNGNYTYELEVTNLCGQTCDNYLVVSKGDKELSNQVCN